MHFHLDPYQVASGVWSEAWATLLSARLTPQPRTLMTVNMPTLPVDIYKLLEDSHRKGHSSFLKNTFFLDILYEKYTYNHTAQ